MRWFGLFVGGIALALGVALVARAMRPARPLPVLGAVPAFHLVDQRGAPYANDAMLGHASVVDFVFTRCPSSCPRLTARMGQLQARLAKAGSDVRLVSF
ncbi:MAG TPA: SCO family protein, partial [Polyangiaceae bacterium]